MDATGKVTAIAEGKVTIEATTNDGDKTASCQITIVNRGVEISKPEVSDITSVSALVEGAIKLRALKLRKPVFVTLLPNLPLSMTRRLFCPARIFLTP